MSIVKLGSPRVSAKIAAVGIATVPATGKLKSKPRFSRAIWLAGMPAKLPDPAATVRDQIPAKGAPHPLNGALADIFADRAKWVQGELERPIDG
jgi:hypothetical protein